MGKVTVGNKSNKRQTDRVEGGNRVGLWLQFTGCCRESQDDEKVQLQKTIPELVRQETPNVSTTFRDCLKTIYLPLINADEPGFIDKPRRTKTPKSHLSACASTAGTGVFIRAEFRVINSSFGGRLFSTRDAILVISGTAGFQHTLRLRGGIPCNVRIVRKRIIRRPFFCGRCLHGTAGGSAG